MPFKINPAIFISWAPNKSIKCGSNVNHSSPSGPSPCLSKNSSESCHKFGREFSGHGFMVFCVEIPHYVIEITP